MIELYFYILAYIFGIPALLIFLTSIYFKWNYDNWNRDRILDQLNGLYRTYPVLTSGIITGICLSYIITYNILK